MIDVYSALRPILFALPPETAHHVAMSLLRAAPPWLARQIAGSTITQSISLFGVDFRNRVGLAAGFDKNGVALPAWEALGFGFAEIGTVTAKAQPGNPKPRIFRLPEKQALINRLGFNNDGADVVARRLERLRRSGRWPAIPIGINIGKSKSTPLAEAFEDYRYSFRRLHSHADYIVLNVSSPNTPGLRSLQAGDSLGGLLHAIQNDNAARKPIMVKIAPDVSPSQLVEIITTCEEGGAAGLIATNTTLDHSSIAVAKDEEGGLSGAPLREKSTSLIRDIAAQTKLPIIGCGGIFDQASAQEKVEAGAGLLQVYTGFVYRGPALIREIAAW